jgi:hypothetical protein
MIMFKFLKTANFFLPSFSLAIAGLSLVAIAPIQAEEIVSPSLNLPLLQRRALQLKTFQDGSLNSGSENMPRVADLDHGSLNQVTNVSELRDIQPTDWAYEALKSLVERYGCIVGYPDRTFRGNRALTRWEFAAGLNACLNTIERLLQENVAVLREDLDKLKQLSQQFEQELASIGARVDNLESRTAYLEDHQFSTTTKLSGDVILAYSGVWGSEQASGHWCQLKGMGSQIC